MSKAKKYRRQMFIEFLTDLFISVWLFMVGVGACHHSVNPHIPLISFWQSFLIIFTLWQLVPYSVQGSHRTVRMLEKKWGYDK